MTQRPRMLSFVAATMVSTALSVVLGAKQPRLVLGVFIEGLRMETLQDLAPYFGHDGFNRLLRQGAVITDADFGPGLDAASATALLLTGAAPAANGIPAAVVYDAAKLRTRNVFDDGVTMGNYTDMTLSPATLQVSTIADEVKVAGNGVGMVYAIASDAACAVIQGGHSANSAVFVNDVTGNWATSTFYKEFPVSASMSNRTAPLSARLDTISWTPMQASGNAAWMLPEHLRTYPFRHTFKRNDPDRFARYLTTPLANADIVRLATQYVSTYKLGIRQSTDMLTLSCTLEPFPGTRTTEARYETIDAYMRADAALASLFKAAERNTADNGGMVILVAGLPPRQWRRPDDETWGLPDGTFSTRKAMSLLNMYLMAVHGTGQWVSGYHDGRVYLNADLIKQNNKDIADMRSQAAAFLQRMSGVLQAYTIDQIITGTAPVDDPQGLRRNTTIAYAGDVFVQIIPGWKLQDDYNRAGTTTPQTAAVAALTTAPVFILAPEIPAQTIGVPVDARRIAPTVTRQLRIRSPNGAGRPPLSLQK